MEFVAKFSVYAWQIASRWIMTVLHFFLHRPQVQNAKKIHSSKPQTPNSPAQHLPPPPTQKFKKELCKYLKVEQNQLVVEWSLINKLQLDTNIKSDTYSPYFLNTYYHAMSTYIIIYNATLFVLIFYFLHLNIKEMVSDIYQQSRKNDKAKAT